MYYGICARREFPIFLVFIKLAFYASLSSQNQIQKIVAPELCLLGNKNKHTQDGVTWLWTQGP